MARWAAALLAASLALHLGACAPSPSGSPPPGSSSVPDATPASPTTDAPSPVPATPVPPPRAGAPGIGDRLYPFLGNGGYDVQAYDLSLQVEPSAGRLEGVARVRALAEASLSRFNLDLVGLEVTSVEVEGSGPAEFRHEGRELVVTPPDPIPADTEFTVTVAYSGTPEAAGEGGAPYDAGWQAADEGFYVFSQPDGAATWFPCNDHPLDPADVTLRVTVPGPMRAVSAGRASSSGETDVFEMEEIPTYLVPLAIGRFAERAGQTGRIAIRSYLAEGLEDAPTEPLELQADMLELFADRFGPYPFDLAGAIVVDDDLPAALETRELVTYTRASIEVGEEIVAHELSHQWFGDFLLLAQWDDIWLNEGFATFAQWLWLEHRRGEAAYDGAVAAAHRGLSGAGLVEAGEDADDAARRAREAFPPPDHPEADDLFNRSVYHRGGLALVALRDLVGDEAFFRTLRVYVDRHGGSHVTTADFLALVQEAAGQEAAELVGRWVGEARLPALPSRGLYPPG